MLIPSVGKHAPDNPDALGRRSISETMALPTLTDGTLGSGTSRRRDVLIELAQVVAGRVIVANGEVDIVETRQVLHRWAELGTAADAVTVLPNDLSKVAPAAKVARVGSGFAVLAVECCYLAVVPGCDAITSSRVDSDVLTLAVHGVVAPVALVGPLVGVRRGSGVVDKCRRGVVGTVLIVVVKHHLLVVRAGGDPLVELVFRNHTSESVSGHSRDEHKRLEHVAEDKEWIVEWLQEGQSTVLWPEGWDDQYEARVSSLIY